MHIHVPTRRTCVAASYLAACLAIPTTCLADPTRHFSPPAIGDSYLAYTLHRMDTMQSEDDFASDESLVSQFLADPTSIYSDLAAAPSVAASARQQEAWRFMRNEMRRRRDVSAQNDKELHREMAWDLGLTKALPGSQTLPDPTIPTPGHIVLESAANLYKAGLSLSMWNRGVNLADAGGKLTTLGAELAISAQILRDWAAATEPSDWRRLGIDMEVAARFVAANSLRDLTDTDLAYLAGILRSEWSTWRAGRPSRHGVRELPTPLRMARAAMVHNGQSGPASGACLPDGSANRSLAGASPENLSERLCTTEATDRAVYRRYRTLRDFQIHQSNDAYGDPVQAERLIRFFGPIRPAWAGFFHGRALDYANHAEVIEAQMALEADGSEDSDVRFWRLVERANLLLCRSAAE